MQKMFWIDLEMTGLDYDQCVILEAAVVITDLDLNVIDDYQAVIYRSPEVLASMDPWCIDTHAKTGLSADVLEGRPLEEVEAALVALADKHFGEQKIILCGNSVQTDKRFLEKEMKRFALRLHYRVVDVSSFKEVFASRYGVSVEKKDVHRARSDILESVGELAHYLKYVNIPRS
jgi:oligoribonuclease